MKKSILTFAGAFALSAMPHLAGASDLREAALEMFKPLPSTLPALNENTITPEKVALGKALFFDPRMSA